MSIRFISTSLAERSCFWLCCLIASSRCAAARRFEQRMTHGTGTQLRPLIFLIAALLLASFARADVSLERRGPIVIAGNGRINLQIHLDRGTVDYLPVDAPGKIVGAAAGIVLQPAGARLLTTQYPLHSLVEPLLSPLADRIGNGQQLI